jgi:hypothetical protein
VNDDGSISTFRDIYGHDTRMTVALGKKSAGFEVATEGNARDHFAKLARTWIKLAYELEKNPTFLNEDDEANLIDKPRSSKPTCP